MIIILIGSFGLPGVPGGAMTAALITLSALNFPVELVAVLVAIDPILDMGFTMLNVNDGMVTAAVTGKICKEVDMDKFNSNYIDSTFNLNEESLKKLLIYKFNEIDFNKAKEDVLPFISNSETLNLWDKEFFIKITKDANFK